MTKPESISFASVWDAIEDDPLHAQDMKQRSALGSILLEYIREQGWDPEQAARRLRVPRASITALFSGNIQALSCPLLTAMCDVAGLATQQ